MIAFDQYESISIMFLEDGCHLFKVLCEVGCFDALDFVVILAHMTHLSIFGLNIKK